jgi:hypothetical protein
MIRKPVASSNLSSVGYEDHVLEIEFHSGSVYQYDNVPYSVYASLMTAVSKGRFFAAAVKDRYPCRRIS